MVEKREVAREREGKNREGQKRGGNKQKEGKGFWCLSESAPEYSTASFAQTAYLVGTGSTS